MIGTRLVVLALPFAVGCSDATTYWQLATDIYDYPPVAALCFRQDGIDWRAEHHCPDVAQAHDATMLVVGIAAAPVGWSVTMQAPLPGDAAGASVFAERAIFVADVPYSMTVATHELLHAALWELAGDPDYQHEDYRWGLCSC